MEKGYLQHKAELSRFDDSVIKERHAFEKAAAQQAAAIRASDPLQNAVPGNDNILYNPTHHSADYAGLVSRDALERQHFEGKQKESMVKSEYGILPNENVRTSDHTGIGRKHFENDVRFSSKEVVPGSAPLLADPSYFNGGDRDRFQSTAMAAQRQLPTDQRLYSNKSINNLNVGKKHVTPAFEQRGQYLGDMTNQGSGGQSSRPNYSYASEAPQGRGELVGYRATAFKAGAQSMISGIGSSIVGNVSRDFPSRPVKRETIEDSRSREKGTYLLDVTPGVTPGYTGRAMR